MNECGMNLFARERNVKVYRDYLSLYFDSPVSAMNVPKKEAPANLNRSKTNDAGSAIIFSRLYSVKKAMKTWDMDRTREIRAASRQFWK